MHGKRGLSTTRKTRTSCSLFLGRLRLLAGIRGFLPRGGPSCYTENANWLLHGKRELAAARKTRTSCSLFLGRLRLLAGIRGFLPRGKIRREWAERKPHGKHDLPATRKTQTSCSLFLGRLRLLVGIRGFLPRGDCCDWVTTRKTRPACGFAWQAQPT